VTKTIARGPKGSLVQFVYAAFLHARFTRGWGGKRAAWLSIIGFAATIFCYLGVNLVLSGLHSYGGKQIVVTDTPLLAAG